MNLQPANDGRGCPLDDIELSLMDMLFGLAGNRADELKNAIEAKNIRLIAIDEQHESPLVAIPETAEIHMHMPVLKRQLVMAYAYVLGYKASKAAFSQGALGIKCQISPEGLMAVELLRWAMLERVRVAAARERRWELPNENLPAYWYLPHQDDRNGKTAINLFHIALAADLHHELAHLILEHGADHPENALIQEEEADKSAASWILSGYKQEDEQFKGRILGLLLSQLYEVFLVREGFRSDNLHPPLIDRLRLAVNPYVSDPNHAAWAFIFSALNLHLELANKRHDDDRSTPYPTFRDSAVHLMSFFESPP
jgi:hypothetical protein